MSFRGRGDRHLANNDNEANGYSRYNRHSYPHSTQPPNVDFDKSVKHKLEQFERSNKDTLSLPFLNKNERKRVHELAKRYGFNSHSIGKDPGRTCVITRRSQVSNIIAGDMPSDTQPVRISNEIKTLIAALINKSPISPKEVQTHLAISSSQKARNHHSLEDLMHCQPMLIPPRSECLPDMMRIREQLPAFRQRNEILDAINKHQVVLITGGTGCGKTTQVPQFILDDAHHRKKQIRIICTQPRRLPAISVAERVSKERNEKVGATVGYHIRLEQKVSSNTVLTYCTSGVLLRMLTQDDTAKDVSHIILDEIHEREQNTDYLLIALKQALKRRKDLKIILMSATMEGNLKMFMGYFGERVKVFHIDIPSRLFHVEKFYLNEILALTGHVPKESIFSGYSVGSSFPTIGSWGGSEKRDWNDGHGHSMSMQPHSMQTFAMAHSQSQSSLHATMSATNLHQKSPAQQVLFENVAHQIAGSQAHASGVQPQNFAGQGYNYPPPPPPPPPPQGQYSHPPPMMNQPMYYNQPYGNGHFSQQPVYPPYSQPPPNMPGTMQHSATWGGGMDQANQVYYQEADVIDLPCDHVEPETMKMLGVPYKTPGPSGVDSCQPSHDQPAPSWQHTQSYPVINNNAQMQSGMQSWDGRQHVMSSQSTIAYEQTQYQPSCNAGNQPVFYVANDDSNGPGKSMTYFSQPMDGSVGYPMSHSYDQSAQSSSFGGDEVNSYKASLQRDQQIMNWKRGYIMNALTGKPPNFTPDAKFLLHHSDVDKKNLIEHYMDLGGRQYTDSIDQHLIVSVIQYCLNSPIEGAILVFLPGYEDINQVREKVLEYPRSHGYQPQIFILHSQMNSADQQRVFDPPAPGRRKIILSTNIAEASLTIDDVVFVIDTGKVKEKTYDHTSRISQLKVAWIAKSNAEQRAGRAGRCREGFCFRLYSIRDYHQMSITQTAEMQRAAIHDVCLHAKMFAPENMTVKNFLQLAPEPPPIDAIDHSMQFLEQLGALYSEASTSESGKHYSQPEAELTDMGRLIALLPLDPQLARLLLFGVSLRCLSSVVTLVAALSYRDPFVLPTQEDREKANQCRDIFGQRDFSDHVSLMRAVNEFDNKGHKDQMSFCKNNFLSLNVLKMVIGVRRQLLYELRRARIIQIPDMNGDVNQFLQHPAYNRYSNCWPVVQAAIVAGCYPGIGYVKNGNKLKKIRTTSDGNATLHPSSVIKRQLSAAKKNESNIEPNVEFLVFQEMAKIDEGLTLRTVTVVPPSTIVLFSGAIRLKKIVIDDFNIVDDCESVVNADECNKPPTDDDDYPQLYCLQLDDWIGVRGPYEDLQRLMQLRFKFMSYFLEVMRDPLLLNRHNPEYEALLDVLAGVLYDNHSRSGFNPVTNIVPPISIIPRNPLQGSNQQQVAVRPPGPIHSPSPPSFEVPPFSQPPPPPSANNSIEQPPSQSTSASQSTVPPASQQVVDVEEKLKELFSGCKEKQNPSRQSPTAKIQHENTNSNSNRSKQNKQVVSNDVRLEGPRCSGSNSNNNNQKENGEKHNTRPQDDSKTSRNVKDDHQSNKNSGRHPYSGGRRNTGNSTKRFNFQTNKDNRDLGKPGYDEFRGEGTSNSRQYQQGENNRQYQHGDNRQYHHGDNNRQYQHPEGGRGYPHPEHNRHYQNADNSRPYQSAETNRHYQNTDNRHYQNSDNNRHYQNSENTRHYQSSDNNRQFQNSDNNRQFQNSDNSRQFQNTDKRDQFTWQQQQHFESKTNYRNKHYGRTEEFKEHADYSQKRFNCHHTRPRGSQNNSSHRNQRSNNESGEFESTKQNRRGKGESGKFHPTKTFYNSNVNKNGS